MLFGIFVAILTAAVAAALLYPLLRGAYAGADDRAGEAAVYRDQLRELDRDRQQGLITDGEAEYARAEIARRLLAVSGGVAAGDPAKPSARRRRVAEILVILCLPAIGLGIYLDTGSPELPAQPLQARLDNPGNDVGILIVKAEQHLAKNPDDGAGWDLLAPIYVRNMRLGDAEMAYRNAIRLIGPSAERLNGLGETLVAAADGVVTADARATFEAALKLEPQNFRTRFYIALGKEQAGQYPDAKGDFEAILKDSPANAPWLSLVKQHITLNSGPPVAIAPGDPTEQQVADAQAMSSDDRTQMIEGMVAGLDAKLAEDPNNIEGWLRLVRSYTVLKQPDKAGEALKRGLAVFPADSAGGKQLLALAAELGLSTAGASQ